MKLVRLYELNVKEVALPEYDPYIEMTRHQPLPMVSRRNLEPYAPILAEYTTERIEIQEFCEQMIPERLMPLHMGEPVNEIRTDRQYIAIDKDLEKLLVPKWANIAEEAQLNASNQEAVNKKWWSMPWYKRVLSAIMDK